MCQPLNPKPKIKTMLTCVLALSTAHTSRSRGVVSWGDRGSPPIIFLKSNLYNLLIKMTYRGYADPYYKRREAAITLQSLSRQGKFTRQIFIKFSFSSTPVQDNGKKKRNILQTFLWC